MSFLDKAKGVLGKKVGFGKLKAPVWALTLAGAVGLYLWRKHKATSTSAAVPVTPVDATGAGLGASGYAGGAGGAATQPNQPANTDLLPVSQPLDSTAPPASTVGQTPAPTSSMSVAPATVGEPVPAYVAPAPAYVAPPNVPVPTAEVRVQARTPASSDVHYAGIQMAGGDALRTQTPVAAARSAAPVSTPAPAGPISRPEINVQARTPAYSNVHYGGAQM